MESESVTFFNNDFNLNNNNNNNNSNYSVSKLSIDKNKTTIQRDKINSKISKTYCIDNIYENQELPIKFIIKNIRIKIFRIIYLVIMKIYFFFCPPIKPSKDDKVFYIKK